MSAITFTLRLKSVLENKKIFQKLLAFKLIILLETVQNASTSSPKQIKC